RERGRACRRPPPSRPSAGGSIPLHRDRAVDLDEVPRGVAEVREADAPVRPVDDLARLGAALSETRQSGLEVIDAEDEHRAVSGVTEIDDLRLPDPSHDRDGPAAACADAGEPL